MASAVSLLLVAKVFTLGHAATCSIAPPQTPSCTGRCAPLLGSVGMTTLNSNNDDYLAKSWPSGTTIAGPFEAGFDANIDNLLTWMGCSPASKGYLDGGTDTQTALDMVAYQCGIKLPRVENGVFKSLMFSCGVHSPPTSGCCTSPQGSYLGETACVNPAYHFHQNFTCLYSTAAAGHSIKIGTSAASSVAKYDLYGMYESTGVLPDLDYCGGHFGVTPSSNGASIYHHHVQTMPPFTYGCYGPNDSGGLVTLEQCRSYNPACGNSAYVVTITTSAETGGTRQYNKWCPCFNKCGSNIVGATCNTTITTKASTAATPATTTAATRTASLSMPQKRIGSCVLVLILITLPQR